MKHQVRDWREPALKLLLILVEAGGYRVSKEVIESALLSLSRKESDGSKELISYRLPAPIWNLLFCLMEVVEAVRREPPDCRPQIRTPGQVLDIFGDMVHLKQEVLKVVFLDFSHRVLFDYNAALGVADRITVDSRSIFKLALEWESCKILLLHNHPSGILDPSDEDIVFTQKMYHGCKFLGIELLDHLILGWGQRGKKYLSFAEKKLI